MARPYSFTITITIDDADSEEEACKAAVLMVRKDQRMMDLFWDWRAWRKVIQEGPEEVRHQVEIHV